MKKCCCLRSPGRWRAGKFSRLSGNTDFVADFALYGTLYVDILSADSK
jgi:hypothetical protein